MKKQFRQKNVLSIQGNYIKHTYPTEANMQVETENIIQNV